MEGCILSRSMSTSRPSTDTAGTSSGHYAGHRHDDNPVERMVESSSRDFPPVCDLNVSSLVIQLEQSDEDIDVVLMNDFNDDVQEEEQETPPQYFTKLPEGYVHLYPEGMSFVVLQYGTMEILIFTKGCCLTIK